MTRAFGTWWRVCTACALLLLNACANPSLQKAANSSDSYWQGRLSVKVLGKAPQAFSANFELQGQPSRGELLLTTPLGTTLARMRWDEASATLDAQGGQRSYHSVQELARQVTGADLPIATLFAWLQGIDEVAPGWQADLQNVATGRISAKHFEEVESEIRIILDR